MSTIRLELSDEEATYVQDILQMWMEGIEKEVEGLADETDDEAHWSRYQLRKQFEVAGRVRLRINLEKGET